MKSLISQAQELKDKAKDEISKLKAKIVDLNTTLSIKDTLLDQANLEVQNLQEKLKESKILLNKKRGRRFENLRPHFLFSRI